MWKRDIERVGYDHSGLSHDGLSRCIRDELQNKYPNVYWVVIVYNELSGWEAHTVKGQYYHLFRYHGHNIVVGRVVSPNYYYAPANLESTFWEAYAPVTYTTISWWTIYTHLHARNTVNRIWDNLEDEGLSPIMLHIFTSGSYGHYDNCDGRCEHVTLPNGYGYATVIAEDR